MKASIKIAITLLACSSWITIGLAAENTKPEQKKTFIIEKPSETSPATATLKLGDAAPAFTVTQWYKGDPVKIEADKTYIIECWATWCGPCVKAFPHLSEIAKANEGKITVIGVNVWEKKNAEEVKAFIDGQGEKMSYHVVADGEGAIANLWLKAAGQNGIPCAFIVSKGKIVWIGHPSLIKQEMLTSITDGTYDIAAAQKTKEKHEILGNYFKQHIVPFLTKKDIEGALRQMELMKKEFPEEEKDINLLIDRMKTQLQKEGTPKKTP